MRAKARNSHEMGLIRPLRLFLHTTYIKEGVDRSPNAMQRDMFPHQYAMLRPRPVRKEDGQSLHYAAYQPHSHRDLVY